MLEWKDSIKPVQSWGTADLTESLKEAISADKVEGLGEVDECNVQGHPLLSALLLELTEGEDHVYCRPFSSEATLWFWVDALSQLLQTDQEDPGIDFANDAEKRDTSVVVAVASLTLVLVQGNDLGISHVLWHSSLSLALVEDFMQGVQ